jgi:hypothetical protein
LYNKPADVEEEELLELRPSSSVTEEMVGN